MPDLDTSLAYCTYCPKLCRHVCPVSNAEARETVTPQAKMASMSLLHLGPARGGIVRTVENAASAYACSGCGACAEACLHHVTPGRHLFTARAEAERSGHGAPELAGLPERVRARAEQAALAAREGVQKLRRCASGTALLPGCEAPAAAGVALDVAERLGASLGLAEVSLSCGGYPLLAGGFEVAFRLHAEALAEQVAGITRLVVACPACAWAMKTEYAACGVPLAPEIVTLPSFLAAHADALPPPSTREGSLDEPGTFYHDPCYLGRWLGEYDPPRRLLARAGVAVREFSRSREASECSGGGGVLPLTRPATADAIADQRLVEVNEAGASEIITACPTCTKRLTRDGVRARDLVEVIAERLGSAAPSGR